MEIIEPIKRHKWENDTCTRCGCERRKKPATDGFVSYKVFTEYNKGDGYTSIRPSCN